MICVFTVRIAVTVSGVMSAFDTGIGKSILFSLLTLLIFFSGLLIVIVVPIGVAMRVVPVVCLSNI